MNEKEKAEAYVRSQIKELMELSFGCRGVTNDRTWVMMQNGNWVIEDSPLDSYSIFEPREIIGHPIQLQHYLQILDKIADKQKVIYRLINCRVLYFGKVIVKFHQKTGQPEDEEDWKAFNQIVGI